MADLFDITPLARAVVIRRDTDAEGNPLDEPIVTRLLVRGIGLDDLMEAAFRFPALKVALGGAMDGQPNEGTFAQELMNSAPGAVFALMAAALGEAGNQAYENGLRKNLAIDELAELLQTVVELSLPKGIRPFFQRLRTWISYLPQQEPAAGGEGEVKAAA